MSERRDKGETGGWEEFAEEASGGSLQPSEELEQAMREAAESVEGHRAAQRPEEAKPAAPEGRSGAPSPASSGEVPRAEPPPPSKGEPDPGSGSQELEATRDRLMRLAADFENFRRRALKEREETHVYGCQNLVKDLLPTVDNLERAIDHAAQGGGGEVRALREGVELVLRDLHAVLAKHGVTPLEAESQPFDPVVHEAMAQAPDASVPPNTVVRVFQRGYRLRDRLLRPARVVVSCPPQSTEPAGSAKPEE